MGIRINFSSDMREIIQKLKEKCRKNRMKKAIEIRNKNIREIILIKKRFCGDFINLIAEFMYRLKLDNH